MSLREELNRFFGHYDTFHESYYTNEVLKLIEKRIDTTLESIKNLEYSAAFMEYREGAKDVLEEVKEILK